MLEKIKTVWNHMFCMQVEEQYRELVLQGLGRERTADFRIISIVIMVMQAFMAVVFLTKAGGPFTSFRSTGYFLLYCSLFLVTIVLYCCVLKNKKCREAVLNQKLSIFYASVLCFWGCAVTLLDQIGGNGLSVYCTMILTIGVFSLLEPVCLVVIFGISCLVLNLLLPLFPNGMDNLFSNIVNSGFITMLSMVISVIMYRNKSRILCDQHVMQHQYDEIARMNRKLNELVMTDPLTQMKNRRYLTEECPKLLETGSGTGEWIAGLMIDIDHFKQYNDHYGHQKGDLCLQKIAGDIMDAVKDLDAFAVRYGGEEFFVCILGCNEKQAMVFAEELRHRIEKLCFKRADIDQGYVTVSVGAAVQKSEKHDLEALLKEADQMLYEAKRRGRNCCVLAGRRL